MFGHARCTSRLPALIRRVFQAFLLMSTLTANAASTTIDVKHAQGETMVPVTPEKVLVFDLSVLDNLDRLGIEVAGVPRARNYPHRLKKYQSDDFIKIGSLSKPDYEVINAARPDLIIVAYRSQSKYDALAKIAPTIDLTGSRKDLIADVEADVTTLGRIFAKEAEAKMEVEKLDDAVSALKAKAKGTGKGLVIMTSGGKISAYGPGSRFGIIYDDFGIMPAVRDISAATHGQPIGSEFILEADPDWLFVIDRDAALGREGASAKQILDNELVRETTAWKKKQVVYLDAGDWYLARGGLNAVHRAIDQIAQAFDNAG